MFSVNKLCLEFFLVVVFLFPSIIFAKDVKYKVAEIPAELKENAKAVVRNNKVVFEIKSINSAVMQVDYAITILNKNGINNSYFIEFYNKFRKISNIKAKIYNERGEKIKKISNEKIKDYSAISGYSLYADNRVKYIDPEIRITPFTVEYSYKIKFKGLLHFPSFLIYSDYNISVEKSTFKVIAPKDYILRYFERNINTKVKIGQNDKFTSYTWDTTNAYAIKKEAYSLPLTEYCPVVFIAPSEFEIDKYKGNCESWKNFGMWINQLNSERDILSVEAQNKIKNLVNNIDDDFEKIKVLYDYLQNNTRYVSIQVGIGGWQPFEAETVERLSYGDCKALTNYMKTILKIAGIKSCYALVNAGKNAPQLIREFPSNQFNHAFLFVPLKNDTIWLECTSQHAACGYIGGFTDDRDVLAINDEGGKIVHTKIYTGNDNKQITKTAVILDSQGNGSVNIKADYQGVVYDKMRSILRSDDADKKKLLYRNIKIPSFDIRSFNHEEIKNIIPVVRENLKLDIRDYGIKIGNKMLVTLNLMNKMDSIPKRIKDRRSDILIRRSYIEVDTITYNIPEKYFLQETPDNITITTQFGEYKTEILSNVNKVQYVRYLKMKKGTYPSYLYDDFVAFFENIYKADEGKLILTK
jgi:hypothetical protein